MAGECVTGYEWVVNQQIQMMAKAVSEGTLPLEQLQNAESRGQETDLQSLKESSASSNSGALSRGRSISRKPAQQSNLQSYKLLKRRSQESRESHSQEKKLEQPPKCPKSTGELGGEWKGGESGGRKQGGAQGGTQGVGSEGSKSGGRGEGKFKKKAMTKKEVIQIREYMQSSQLESAQTNSLAGSERMVEPCLREREHKKSKTQYFNENELRGLSDELSQNVCESEKALVASLREKCKSVDQTNILLNKRLNWLREEIEVHLERQSEQQKNESELSSKVRQQAGIIQAQQQRIAQLVSLLQSKERELEQLRTLVVQLNLKFEGDRQRLTAEMELLKAEHWEQAEEREQAHQERVRGLEEELGRLGEGRGEEYSSGVIAKLVSENKYLKMENHMLGRFKERAEQLRKENKQISNERDTLKKKIIENLRKNHPPIDDSADLSSLLSLSLSLTHSS